MTDSGSLQNWLTVFLLFGTTFFLFIYLFLRKRFDFSEDPKFLIMEDQ